MPGASNLITRIAVSAVLCTLTVFLGYFARRSEFETYLTAYCLFFGLYVYLLFRAALTAQDIRWYTGLGIFLRCLLLFSLPNFSDDVYRFLWDGRLLVHGIHPFAHVPAYFMEQKLAVSGITPELFSKLNSPGYFTVYPPICQAVFALAAWLFPANDAGGVCVMKLFLLATEAGTIWIISRHVATDEVPGKGNHPFPVSLAYALNPLAVMEITGNCHFEGAMIFFLLAGISALQRNRISGAAIWFALAVAVKILPLMFLPIIWRRLGWRRGLRFCTVFGLVGLLLFAPLFDMQVLSNMVASLQLYFRQFQFNASAYYIVKGTGWWLKGYDVGFITGPWLGLATGVGVLVLAAFTKPARHPGAGKFELAESMLFAMMLYFSFSAVVHPWYVTVPLALGFCTRRRFAVLWSGLIALSYSHYAGGAYLEQYALIALEYALLWGYMFWEIRKAHELNPSRSPPRNNLPGF